MPMGDEKDHLGVTFEPQRATDQEPDMHDDAMVYVALRGAVKPDDLALWEVQELCQAFLRHLHRRRGE